MTRSTVGREVEYELWAVYPNNTNEAILQNAALTQDAIVDIAAAMNESAQVLGNAVKYVPIKVTIRREEL